jgi:nucleolysin TIA-1/TIAR
LAFFLQYMLQEIFAVAGPVMAVKIIPDRTYAHGGLNYGFVEYHEMRAAETALQTLNGRKIFDTEIRVNWAYQNQAAKEDLTHHVSNLVFVMAFQYRILTNVALVKNRKFHVFVGDLSPDVNDEVLGKAFAAFGSLSDARVMWDMNSGKSRGYGFLAFRDKTDAEQAIATMNGEWLGSRAIRVNWANQKNQGMMGSNAVPGPGPGPGGPGGPGPMRSPSAGGGGGGGYGSTPVSYEAVVAQSPPNATTVYVGNLVPYATQADLIPLFQGFGYIVEIRMQADRGFAFVKLDSHENAAMAIVNLQGTPVHGRALRCSWGKDRSGGDTSAPIAPPAAGYGMQQPVSCSSYLLSRTFDRP